MTADGTGEERPTRPNALRVMCHWFGHRWVQPEGIFTRRECARCGAHHSGGGDAE